MASAVAHPIVLPLSNPTPRAEAIPSDVLAWTEGRALVGTGSPFDDVHVGGRDVPIAQVNNIYIFPGVGLGAIAVGATCITDTMITAAAGAVAELAASIPGEALLPPVELASECATAVAGAVARRAVDDGMCPPLTEPQIDERIAATIWAPRY